ncbi:MAG: BTAD domain-containing putative transcriptional regulator [Vulcanimicrobiaceae bacterium]
MMDQVYVQRQLLLGRLARIVPQIVALVAPAGFGKSTFARQFVSGQGPFAVCDCAHVVNDLDFARRLVPALADEAPERAPALSQRELMLGDAGASSPERVWLALSAWREAPGASTFLFENAEHLLGAGSARELFTRLLSERPDSRRIVICSRESLKLHLSRFAVPHQIVTLRANELAFTKPELDEIFLPLALEQRTLERIMTVSQGWPIAVLLFRRFASEGRIDELLGKIDDVAFEELHDYLADQVLATFPAELEAALFAAACIPEARPEDVAAATGSHATAALLVEFAKTSPFVARTSDGAFVVHPLMNAILLEGRQHRRDQVLAAAASAHERSGDYMRAAELELARPRQEAAARLLERVPVAEYHAPPMRYSRVLASLDRRLVGQDPTLCSCSALFQTLATDTSALLAQMDALEQTLPADTPPEKLWNLNTVRAALLNHLGRFEEALALAEKLAPSATTPEIPQTQAQAYALFLRGMNLARMGAIEEAERELQRSASRASAMDVMASAIPMVRAMDVALVRGQFAKTHALLDRSIEIARHSEFSNFVAYRLAEAAFAAWFSGEDERFERMAAELETLVESNGIRGFSYFAHVARGRRPDEPAEFDLWRPVACAELIACAQTSDLPEAHDRALAAQAAARAYSAPFLRVLAAVAVGLFSIAEARTNAFNEARAAAGEIESQPLRDSVEAVAADLPGAGMLANFVGRYRRRRPAFAPPRLEVSIVRGSVSSRGVEVALSERELSLLFALAIKTPEVTRDRLIDMLWPDLDADAARNALHVSLHRLRQRLGNDGAIVRTANGYRLCSEAQVDLSEIERQIAALRKREGAASSTRELRELYERVRVAFPARITAWEWFAPIERRVSEIRCELAQRLARASLDSGDASEALLLAHEMIEHDPYDESAREIAIKALLAAGDRGAALRHFQQYRETLRSELQCEPSQTLLALVGLASAERLVGARSSARP